MFRVKQILSDHISLKNEISFLEERLAALPEGSEEEARVRRALLRDRLQAAKTERAVYSLPSPRRRRLLEARYLQGMSWQEIAGLFSLSESTLYALHRAALKELEERMFPG